MNFEVFGPGTGENVPGVTPSSLTNAWHWWELHCVTTEGGPSDMDLYLDGDLVHHMDSTNNNGSGTAMWKMLYVQFDGTLNQGNTQTFQMRLDEIGLATFQMGVPS